MKRNPGAWLCICWPWLTLVLWKPAWLRRKEASKRLNGPLENPVPGTIEFSPAVLAYQAKFEERYGRKV